MEPDSIERITRILKQNDIADYYIKQLQLRQEAFYTIIQQVDREDCMHFKHTINDDFTINVLASEQDIRELFLKYPKISPPKANNRIDISKTMSILDVAIADLEVHKIKLPPDMTLQEQKVFILSLNIDKIQQKCQDIAQKALSQVQKQLNTSSQGMSQLEFYQVWKKYFPMIVLDPLVQWQKLIQACKEHKSSYTFVNNILTINSTGQIAINRKKDGHMKSEIWIPLQLVDLLHSSKCFGTILELMFEGQEVLNDGVVYNILGRLELRNNQMEQDAYRQQSDLRDPYGMDRFGTEHYKYRSEIKQGETIYDQQQMNRNHPQSFVQPQYGTRAQTLSQMQQLEYQQMLNLGSQQQEQHSRQFRQQSNQEQALYQLNQRQYDNSPQINYNYLYEQRRLLEEQQPQQQRPVFIAPQIMQRLQEEQQHQLPQQQRPGQIAPQTGQPIRPIQLAAQQLATNQNPLLNPQSAHTMNQQPPKKLFPQK